MVAVDSPRGGSASVGSIAESLRTRFGVSIAVEGPATDIVSSVTHDSKLVEPGALFVCVRGNLHDGHQFASDAQRRGAVAVLADHYLPGIDIAQLIVADTRSEMSRVAAAVYGYPGDSLTLIGVTGTNGKTTTAHTLEAILRRAGRNVAVIGTLTQKRTTPEGTDTQARLADLRDSGVDVVVMEVTSHALELQRVRGLRFQLALFTNLSQDHLDFHGSIEAYFRAKSRLFTTEYADAAIVNGDDPRGRLLFDAATIPTSLVSLGDAVGLQLHSTRSTFTWRGQPFVVPVAGSFNVMNVLEAASAAFALGVDVATIAAAVAEVRVPGRLEPIDCGQNFAVYVDFAHTPDGLQRVLESARETLRPDARLISVFGCGGDRDRGKRPLMAGIGETLSDVLIITSDNPRSEAPAAIAEEMLGGVRQRNRVVVELDRRKAIEHALSIARSGDVVVIAGKGHEQGQEIAGVVTAFDDRDVARTVLSGQQP